MQPNEALAREIVDARAYGRCEGCRCCPGRTFQHRRKRSQGGLWLPSNGVRLCGSGTTGCHGDVDTYFPAIGRLLGLGLGRGDDERQTPAYLHSVAGSGWWLLNDDGTLTYVDVDEITPEQLTAAEWWDKDRPHVKT